MSFFKKKIQKAKSKIKTAATTVQAGAEHGLSRASAAAATHSQKTKKVARVGLSKARSTAEQAKGHLTVGGELLLNGGDRQYWNEELSQLREHFDRLREQLRTEAQVYFEVRVAYHERFQRYRLLRQETIYLGLMAADQLDVEPVTGGNGIVLDDGDVFRASGSDVEQVGRVALGLLSGGVSDIILASQEAKEEVAHLKKEIARLEPRVRQLARDVGRYRETNARLDFNKQRLLRCYGEDARVDSLASKQCALMTGQVRNTRVRQAVAALQRSELGHPHLLETIRRLAVSDDRLY